MPKLAEMRVSLVIVLLAVFQVVTRSRSMLIVSGVKSQELDDKMSEEALENKEPGELPKLPLASADSHLQTGRVPGINGRSSDQTGLS